MIVIGRGGLPTLIPVGVGVVAAGGNATPIGMEDPEGLLHTEGMQPEVSRFLESHPDWLRFLEAQLPDLEKTTKRFEGIHHLAARERAVAGEMTEIPLTQDIARTWPVLAGLLTAVNFYPKWDAGLSIGTVALCFGVGTLVEILSEIFSFKSNQTKGRRILNFTHFLCGASLLMALRPAGTGSFEMSIGALLMWGANLGCTRIARGFQNKLLHRELEALANARETIQAATDRQRVGLFFKEHPDIMKALFKNHLPQFLERQHAEAGRQLDQLRRDQARFQQLKCFGDSEDSTLQEVWESQQDRAKRILPKIEEKIRKYEELQEKISRMRAALAKQVAHIENLQSGLGVARENHRRLSQYEEGVSEGETVLARLEAELHAALGEMVAVLEEVQMLHAGEMGAETALMADPLRLAIARLPEKNPSLEGNGA